MYELNDLLRAWAEQHQRVFTDVTLDNAVHAINEMLPRKRASRYNKLTRSDDGHFVVTDGKASLYCKTFRGAKGVLDQCFREDISVTFYLDAYTPWREEIAQ